MNEHNRQMSGLSFALRYLGIVAVLMLAVASIFLVSDLAFDTQIDPLITTMIALVVWIGPLLWLKSRTQRSSESNQSASKTD